MPLGAFTRSVSPAAGGRGRSGGGRAGGRQGGLDGGEDLLRVRDCPYEGELGLRNVPPGPLRLHLVLTPGEDAGDEVRAALCARPGWMAAPGVAGAEA